MTDGNLREIDERDIIGISNKAEDLCKNFGMRTMAIAYLNVKKNTYAYHTELT